MLGLISQTDLTTTSSSSGGAAAGALVGGLVGLGILVIMLAAMWRIFTKMGEPGWKGLVPIYNIYVIFTRSGREGWMLLLFLVPCVNIIAQWFVADSLGDLFGKGTGFKIGLFLFSPIFLLILAFGSSQHVGGPMQAPPPAPIG